MSSYSIIVPVLLGGQRLSDKNIIMLDGQPLCTYVINTACKVTNPSNIYVLYESEVIKRAISVTEPYPGITFLKRDPKRGGSECTMSSSSAECCGQRCQVHDHYLYDICCKLDTEWIIQLHTTSPLISPQTIDSFVQKMLSTNKDMIISVVKSQKEAFIDRKPANFDPRIKTPTQKLTPVNTICWALTAWRRKKFVELFDSGQSPSFMENFDFFGFPLEECDDIDTYEELLVVEQRLRGKRLAHENTSLRYFDNNIIGIERELHKLLSNDGSALSRSALSNLYGKLSLASIIEEMGPSKSWSYPIMVDGQDQACLIQQIKGDQCRKHYHITKSEFWVVLQGTFEWILDDATYTVSKGEFMRLKPGQVHVIRSIGQQPGIRLAMGGYNMEHVYI